MSIIKVNAVRGTIQTELFANETDKCIMNITFDSVLYSPQFNDQIIISSESSVEYSVVLGLADEQVILLSLGLLPMLMTGPNPELKFVDILFYTDNGLVEKTLRRFGPISTPQGVRHVALRLHTKSTGEIFFDSALDLLQKLGVQASGYPELISLMQLKAATTLKPLQSIQMKEADGLCQMNIKVSAVDGNNGDLITEDILLQIGSLITILKSGSGELSGVFVPGWTVGLAHSQSYALQFKQIQLECGDNDDLLILWRQGVEPKIKTNKQENIAKSIKITNHNPEEQCTEEYSMEEIHEGEAHNNSETEENFVEEEVIAKPRKFQRGLRPI